MERILYRQNYIRSNMKIALYNQDFLSKQGIQKITVWHIHFTNIFSQIKKQSHIEINYFINLIAQMYFSISLFSSLYTHI